jgi:hypothetical protein
MSPKNYSDVLTASSLDRQESGSMPVAIFVFNRPDKAARCLDRVRAYRPRQLFIIADGPRDGSASDAKLCEQSRGIVAAIDWPCDVITDFAEHNLGVMERVSSGITNVFKQVDRAAFLEDDCLVDPSFFGFAETLLERYRDESRVMCINAPNYQRGVRRGDGDYFFTKYALTWGWATWRRAWERFDSGLTQWPRFRRDGLRSGCRSLEERMYWASVYEREFDCVGTRAANWDYAWLLSCWSHNGLSICPQVNLTENIGDGPDATHTTTPFDWQPPVGRIGGTRAPLRVEADSAADMATFRNWYGRRSGSFAWLRRRVGFMRAVMRSLTTVNGREVLFGRR